MTVFLDGIAARFYRGIGADVQFIGPFSRMNFFIGANNAGKSIVLALLAEQLSQIKSGSVAKPLPGPEVHLGRETGQFLLAIGRKVETVLEALAKRQEGTHFQAQHGGYRPPTFHSQMEALLGSLARVGEIWVTPNGHQPPEIYPAVDVEIAKHWITEWQAVWKALHPRSGGGGYTHWIPETLRLISNYVMPGLPNIHLMPAKRVIGKTGETLVDLSGKGLIDHLAALEKPSFGKEKEKEKFNKINRFLQEVSGKTGAVLEIPHDREHLLVHMDNKVLPLSSLGTGIHEVVLIAAFCTIHDGCIMCIEEPEIHLHPLLQRKLVNYLIEHTTSQYFIATHSAVFIDTPGANIFRVTNDGEQTRIAAVLAKSEQRGILDDLGYQASDLLQSNAVVWVEGPSDRIYLNHWISEADSELKEGIHYTIMFYGGALIRHLSASDDEVDEFIKLRALNRNMSIVIDSDRESASAGLKPHANRLLKEMSAGDGLVWITAGREMENYLDGDKLQAAIKAVHPRLYFAPGKTGQYDHAFYFYRENPEKKGHRLTITDADKVGVASLICREALDLDILDLRTRLGELTSMIRKANGLKAV